MTNVFEQARAIAASVVAQREGLELTRKGNRHWARCPFHADKTPSLCFFTDGGWKCFVCGAGGDSTAFLAKLKGITQLEAAKAITGDSGTVYKPVVDTFKVAREALREAEQAANTAMQRRLAVCGSISCTMEDSDFIAALQLRSEARVAHENILAGRGQPHER